MQSTVKTIHNEAVRLTSTKTSEPKSQYGYFYVLNSDIVNTYRSNAVKIPLYFKSNHETEGYVSHQAAFGRSSFGSKAVYSIGCKKFNLSTFNAILRNAGAIRKYTKKVKAAAAGR